MTTSPSTWLALDVGGANLKAAHSSGQARTLPFELWKHPEELPRAIARLAATLPPADRLALTMTAELCDCYATKAEGVRSVLDAVSAGLPDQPMIVWGVDGRFHQVDAIRQEPALAAAANWLALATLAARLIPDGPGLLIDIGSTTTDLIPLSDGRVASKGRTDTERLQTGELVYAGVRRTPICALGTELPFRGRPTGLMAELFASTLDVYLILGEIPSDPKDLSTADGRPATADAAVDRLARMVGADRDGFTSEDATEFAQGADALLIDRLTSASDRSGGVRPRHAVVAGSGEFLARRLAGRLGRAGRYDRLAIGRDRAGRLERRVCPCVGRPGRRIGRTAMSRPVVVVKVGGSLLDWPELPARLADYLAHRLGDRLVLVVGGGRFADVLRDLDALHHLGERPSHALALRVLDLTADLVARLVPGTRVVADVSGLDNAWLADHLPILAPRRFLDDDDRSTDPLPHAWTTTTDAIAARLAVRLNAAELVLLKSTDLPDSIDLTEAARLGIVDPEFPRVARDLRKVSLVNFRKMAE